MSSLLRLLLWRADESECDHFDLEFRVFGGKKFEYILLSVKMTKMGLVTSPFVLLPLNSDSSRTQRDDVSN
jgi:hypothetical protein